MVTSGYWWLLVVGSKCYHRPPPAQQSNPPISDSVRVCRKGLLPLLQKVNKLVLLRFTEENWPTFSKHLDINAVSL